MNFKSIIAVAILVCFTLFTATAQQICNDNQTGSQGGYWYTFWTDGGGSVCMNLGSGGQFSVDWSNCGNFVCGKGWSSGSESRTISWSGNSGSSQYYGLYGWMQNPLIEYYIPRGGGSAQGTYQVGGTTWTLNTAQRVNKPSIEGDTTFTQFFCSGGNQPIDFGGHVAGWRSLGRSIGSQNYQVMAIEGWGGSSGSANATVSSGTASTTTSSYSSTTTSNYGSTTTSSGGSGNITVRARGTQGGENLEIRVNGNAVASFSMSTSYANYSASGSGTVQVAFTNDDGQEDGMDIQVDYVQIDGTTYQAEDQATNTGVWENDSCGGSYSEWLHCDGYIEFSGGGGTTTSSWSSTTSSGGSTTSSGGWWWSTTTSSGGSTTTSSWSSTTSSSGGWWWW
jgi:hypothetical protein